MPPPPVAAPSYGAPAPQRSYSAMPAPAAPPAALATALPPDDPEISVSPYPRQSITEVFNGSPGPVPPAQSVPRTPTSYTPSAGPYVPSQPQPAQQNMPRPPTSYTPSAGPYVPNQPAYGAPMGSVQTAVAAPPQPPPAEDQHIPGYPQQSLWDLLSSK